jgi:hypothetical protein
MMFDPLAEVVVGMFMPVVVSRRQLVMNILRHGEWGNREQEEDQADRHGTTQKAWQTSYGST